MNRSIQHKIELFKKLAQSQPDTPVVNSPSTRTDGLAQIIRSEKDAEAFMAELRSAVKRSK